MYSELTTSEVEWKNQQLVNTQNRVSKETTSDPPAGMGWNEYRHQLYRTHMTGFKDGGMIVMTTTETTLPILIDGLWAASDYQIVAYFDNMDPTSPGSDMHLEYATTAAIADCQPVSLLFDGFVSSLEENRVREVLAKNIGVNPRRLQEAKYVATTPRSLQGGNSTAVTEFQFTLVASRAQDVPTPYDLTAFTPERQNNLASDLLTILGLTLSDYSQLPSRPRTKPLWTKPAEVTHVTNTTVTVQYDSNAQGQACCVALSGTNSAISPDQVIEGYSFNWTKVPSQCGTTTQGIAQEMRVSGMKPDEVYFLYCVLTDDYPLWPTQMDYSAALSMPFIPVHTPRVMEVEIQLLSSAVPLLTALLAWLSFL